MQDSKLPLTTWFWAAYLMATHSNGISARLCTKSSTSTRPENFVCGDFVPSLLKGKNDPSKVPTISLLVVTSDEGLWKSVQPEFKSIDDVTGILLHLNYALPGDS